ncbi:MAG: phospho-N-acetylmuramoyl-pentapeptide-transferase [Bacilli bacterium]|nr:phospho-N-acetylmuramoyl-pentapeptide-transferase [Bacilli bacterium]
MLILAKSILGLMLGFFIAIVIGWFLIPMLKKLKCGQNISEYTAFAHASKNGTPTIGGLIFIIPTILAMFILYLRGSLEITHSLLIVLFVFISYAALGFVDDYLKIKQHNNKGLSIVQKLLVQVLIALIFFLIYMKGGGDANVTITSLGISINMGWVYGLFILFLLVGSSNAVNLTDGLDGLAGGLSLIAFLSFGIITWGTSWVEGYQEIAIFCFILVGSILGFLVYNTHPAKVFMGDTGSLALGATLAAVAILTKHELSLAVIGGIFVIEALSSIIQIYSIRKFNKKVFLMAPIHHHFEKLGWKETDIVKMFWIVGFMLGMVAIYYGVWL